MPYKYPRAEEMICRVASACYTLQRFVVKSCSTPDCCLQLALIYKPIQAFQEHTACPHAVGCIVFAKILSIMHAICLKIESKLLGFVKLPGYLQAIRHVDYAVDSGWWDFHNAAMKLAQSIHSWRWRSPQSCN